MEQVTHHPPASCWLITDDKHRFRFFGSAEYHAFFKGNSISAFSILLPSFYSSPPLPLHTSSQFGPERVEYADGTAIEFSWPSLLMSGYVYGQRLSNYRGTITLRDIQNKLQFDISLSFRLTCVFSNRAEINIEFAPAGFVGTVMSWFGKAKKTRPGDFFTGTVCLFISKVHVSPFLFSSFPRYAVIPI